MLRTPHRPLDQPTIVVTVNPATPAPIPANPASESVYSLVYGLADQPAPLYRSRHAERVRAAVKQPQGLNASFERLATDDSRAATVPKTVPSTNTGLYSTLAGRTGSVKRVPPPRLGHNTPPAATSSSSSLSALKAKSKSAPRVPISHRTPALRSKGTPPMTKPVPTSICKSTLEANDLQRVRASPLSQTAKVAPAVESLHHREAHSLETEQANTDEVSDQKEDEEEEIPEQLPTARDVAHDIQQGVRAHGPGVARLLTNQERVDLLAGLQVHWEHLSSAYRRLPISSDTPSKLRRKRDLESQLQDVEADIKKFSGSSITVID
ncbi:hypothetical protein HDU86_007962 [Geranomyces michiganensis]|nr:hypothetical protein HDU86_007962 [Geranomyces michiganensis]